MSCVTRENASRTMLMDLETLNWDEELLGIFNIPRAMLPQFRPCADHVRHGRVPRLR
jgi:glycerol kinase